MHSKSKRIHNLLCLSVSGFDMVDTARVCIGLYFQYFLRISHLFNLLEQQIAVQTNVGEKLVWALGISRYDKEITAVGSYTCTVKVPS